MAGDKVAAVQSRYAAPGGATAAPGWRIERASPPSRLFGANGLRTGADGRIYVAQVAGSAVTALDPDSGAATPICPIDGPITAPDDIAFDSAGNLYATEITLGRVSMLTPSGEYRVVHGDMPVANPITVHQDRLFAGECRMGGRIFELDPAGGQHRQILADVPMPNAFSIGPDGMLYMPIMATNEIWRVDPAGGKPEVIAGDLGVPDSVKFDAKGRIVSTQVASGEVLRIDPVSGAREVLARLAPGLDNCTFVGERLFVSSIPGEVTEILPEGATRSLVGRGLQWPMGLALAGDGSLFVADGGFTYTLPSEGPLALAGFLFSPGFPGFVRGVAHAGENVWVTTNSMGAVMRWDIAAGESTPLSTGHEVLYGVAVGEGDAVAFADGAAGRVLALGNGEAEVLAEGLATPMGVAIASDGSVYASESGGGRVVRCAGSRAETVLDGLGKPQGIAVAGQRLFVVDVERKELVTCDLSGGNRAVIASGLPVKAPPGVRPKLLGGVGDMSGPMVPFCGLAVAGDGTVYVSGDAEGSVLKITRDIRGA
ncbi:SMP-30/gluconolactonase/LRE family protein [Novosphingobium sp. YJ-S2-02]|uniref:SMP-30/gluconolactonase/LRE family protein n=1 Tax=Novosphingobium aureum TaxID=2792964 RepID=A0A931HEJ1_9SPHN|nr:SMP-30/gluconolactonase/LRE family protein [Novosphingobium aureum]MBH0114650.1 SMP-30/gluconolactonase/LRE family protein [Novosphingobium aureum]